MTTSAGLNPGGESSRVVFVVVDLFSYKQRSGCRLPSTQKCSSKLAVSPASTDPKGTTVILGVCAKAYRFTPNLVWSSKLVPAYDDRLATDDKRSHNVLPYEGFSVEGIHICEIAWQNRVAFCGHHAEKLVWSRILLTLKPPGEVWDSLEDWYGAQTSGAKQSLDLNTTGSSYNPAKPRSQFQNTHGDLASMRDTGIQLADSMVLAHFIDLVPKCEHDVEKGTLRVHKPRGPESRYNSSAEQRESLRASVLYRS